jgi:hypothetical protein
MAKMVGLLLVVGALAAAVALVPLNGRTVLARWRDSRGPSDFAARAWREAAAAAGLVDPPTARVAARASKPAAKRAQPAEHHTEADRAALERIVSERAAAEK